MTAERLLLRRIAGQDRLDLGGVVAGAGRPCEGRWPSSVDVSQHDIQAADDPHQVGHQVAFGEHRQGLQVGETSACGNGRGAASGRHRLRDSSPARRAAIRPRTYTLPSGAVKPSVHSLKWWMSGFHADAQLGARRRDEFAVGRLERAGRKAFQRLLDDAQGLAHLFHAAQVAIVDIAVRAERARRTRTARSRRRAAPCACRSWRRTRAATGPVSPSRKAFSRRDHADAARAVDPQRVLGQQAFVLVDAPGEDFQESGVPPARIRPARRATSRPGGSRKSSCAARSTSRACPGSSPARGSSTGRPTSPPGRGRACRARPGARRCAAARSGSPAPPAPAAARPVRPASRPPGT